MSWNIQSQKTNSEQLLLEESLFFTGNGYIGVRGNMEEGMKHNCQTIRGTYINGFYDDVPIAYGEKMTGFPETQQTILNLMDAQSLEIWVEGERFSLENGDILAYQRMLHMDKGYHNRRIHWRSPKGHELILQFRRITSFIYKSLFQQEVIIETLTGAVPITVVSTLQSNVQNFADPNDPRVATGGKRHLSLEKIYSNQQGDYLEMRTSSSGLSVAACSTLSIKQEQVAYEHQTGDCLCTTTARFTLENQIVIEKRTIYADSIRYATVEKACFQMKHQLEAVSSQALYEQQATYLTHFWEHTDVTLSGVDSLQEAVRFNLYHILQSAGQDGKTNIAAKGLSGEGYEGHYFWDTEIYLLPIFTMSNPDMAKKLLLYRYSILPDARRRAKEMGHQQGALFPWRTINGTECSSYFPAGSAQYHISADIAHSFIQYYLATNDIDFLKQVGVEILIETARLWVDTGHFYQGSFRIDAVTGPDEYTCIVNNNYYTNAMAKQNLQWAIKAWEILFNEDPVAARSLQYKVKLKDSELYSFQRAADLMYLPVNKALQINPQDDGFLQKAKWNFSSIPKSHYPLLLHYHPLTIYRYQVCKQADTVLAHLLSEDEQSETVMKHSYLYYEGITSHDSSLSSCVFSMMAARIGELSKAYDYFMKSARLDLDNTQGNTKDGLHLANMGGTWMGIVVGFAGMRLKPYGLLFRPQLPTDWKDYSFRFHYHGSSLRMTVTKDICCIELLAGDPVSLTIWDQKIHVSDIMEVKLYKDDTP